MSSTDKLLLIGVNQFLLTGYLDSTVEIELFWSILGRSSELALGLLIFILLLNYLVDFWHFK